MGELTVGIAIAIEVFMKRIAEMISTPIFGNQPFRFHARQDLHLARKAWHMGMGLMIVFLFESGVSQVDALVVLGTFFSLELILESVRLKNSTVNEKIVRLWAPFMRRHEIRQMSTIPHYVGATLLAIALFPKAVAILAILCLACGDPIASLIGIRFGDLGPRFKNGKSLIGTAAGCTVCIVISYYYLKVSGITGWQSLTLAFVGGLAGGLAELLPLDIDDNFTIPMIAGFVFWLGFMIFGF